MTKKEFIDKVSERTGLTKKDAASAVNAVFEILKERLTQGDRITILGFGTFSISQRSERKGRNPQTGEEMTIPAKRVAKFKPSANLNARINAG